MSDDLGMMSAWFAGPKAENSQWFGSWIGRILEDYSAWRRNYFPEDGVVVDSALRRQNEPFLDEFEDRLLELLARLKGDVPFHSPRYAAHMLAEQTLPGVAGYFAAMLYNPNNVTADVAPVTVRLELEAGRLLSKMLGFNENAWSHLCSGGTSANIEALWVARSVKYLPFVLRDVRRSISLPGNETALDDAQLLSMSPTAALESYAQLWRDILNSPNATHLAAQAAEAAALSPMNVAEFGIGSVCSRLNSQPVLVVPESHHYCFEKALDVLGLGRKALVSVRVDDNFRMRVDDLDSQLRKIEQKGRHVLAVVAVVGSTEEGSIDPIDQISDLRNERQKQGRSSFWLHADGAYGGYLRTITIPCRSGLGSPSTAVKIGGVERELPLVLPEHGECAALERLRDCDSITIDPHKLGYIPYPAGAVCFKNNLVKPLMRQTAPYLEEPPTNPDLERTSETIGLYVLEGSKPGAMAAAVWLSHTLIPLDSTGHGRLMRENIRNACELHALLEHYPDIIASQNSNTRPEVRAVCLCPPGSNILCYAFRPVQNGCSAEQINLLNRMIYERFSLNNGNRVCEQSFFISRTHLSMKQYSLETVGNFLNQLGMSDEDYAKHGVFLLRSVLMNPWHAHAKRRGRYFVSELVTELYSAADSIIREIPNRIETSSGV